MTGPSGFARLWTAAVASNLGDGLMLAAFPLIAVTITDDPVAISAITIAIGLPWLLVAPFSGTIVDRLDRRRLMVATDLFRAVLLAGFAVMVASGSVELWTLYLVVFLVGCGETVVDVSAQALLPSLVTPDRLDIANGRLFSTMTVANRFIGPPLGGLLFGVAIFVPAAADSASFLVAAVIMMTLSGTFRPDGGGIRERRSLWSETVEGLRWLWRNQAIRAFAVGAAAINIGVLAGESILVLFAREQLGLSGFGFGALFASVAAGYVGGSAMAPALTSRLDRRRLVVAAVAGIGLALLLVGAASHWTMAATGLFMIGIAEGIWDVVAVSYRQAAVPDRLRGRIMSAYRVIAHGAVPVGALIGGISTRIVGNRAPFLVGAIVIVCYLPLLARGLRGVNLDPARAGQITPA